MKCRGKISLMPTKRGFRPLVPCNQCLHCRLNRRDRWVTRCLLESQSSTTGQFWTLTFSDSGLDTLAHTGATSLVRKFLNALRFAEARGGNPQRIRCFGALEHGEMFGRPHLHLILWNLATSLLHSTPSHPGLPRPRYHIGQWPHGHVDCQPLNLKSSRYVCKYVTKFEVENEQEPTTFHPQRPPLGYVGLARHVEQLSAGPTAGWEHPTTIPIDGKNWELDQTMLRHYSTLMRDFGLRHERDTLYKSTQLNLSLREKADLESWQNTEAILKKEATRERLFEHTLRRRELREFQIFQRAAAISYQEAS